VSASAFALNQTLTAYLASSDPPDELVVEEATMALLRELVRGPGGRRDPRLLGLRRRVPEVQALLSAEPARRYTLGGLAEGLGVSSYHLSRIFHEEAGVPIARYLVRIRLRNALERVLDGDPVTDVALDAGFSSHSHFTRAFRAEFGVAPRAIRDGSGRDRLARCLTNRPPVSGPRRASG
jgi:AraC family transcriptional regulator